ncbi:hypothetical protein [Yokenella regensburgei]|uniref:Uncharacterized protein n=1 Tax=Yokenella regensburgei TaxID=158877 RepID=A0AB38FXK1_9ENTR|nr:hypothetical protein [Yokenella regensburgei]KFD25301.1 hypothetical protein GYRE_00352 [Yokenella regensburgei ATCC 49455]SQA63338.1 Uncharacterised protein [Yokenella regensburgei]SQA68758.1 Uncharacterised protein [Yokenella regensburgei]SUQ07073.1 Uncharacterised protein [Yokenella regensburgei]
MARNRNNTFEGNFGKTPTDYYLEHFNKPTQPVPGSFLNDHWINFSSSEQRLVSYLNDSYHDWIHHITLRKNSEKERCPTTILQNYVVSTQCNFDSFMRFLLEDLSEEDEIEAGLGYLKKLNDQAPVEDPDFTSLHVKGLRKGLDTVNELLNTNGMDRFEAASYFFTLAFHYLSEMGREAEKSNAMFEAFEQLGEFRGWCSNVQTLESALKKHRDAKKAGNAKAEKNFGSHKREVTRILKEEILPNPYTYKLKTATALHNLLGRRLDEFITANSLNESANSASMIKGWARMGEFKELFDKALSACKRQHNN